MRVGTHDLERAKAAAKLLARCAGAPRLSLVHQALASALGYRDWYELDAVAGSPPARASMAAGASPAVIRTVATRLADTLGLDHGEVEYAIARSRLLGPISLADALTVRVGIWRDRLFGPPGRGRPGTVVRVRAHGRSRPAYLKSMGRPAHLLYDTGYGMCADFEVVTPRTPLDDFAPCRLWLPYGYWTLRDGSEVTFSRDYKPMWRVADGRVERLEPWLWIDGIRGEFHFPTLAGSQAWSHGAARDLAIEHLRSRRVAGLPRLLDAMPHLFEAGVESVSGAVKRLRAVSRPLAA